MKTPGIFRLPALLLALAALLAAAGPALTSSPPAKKTALRLTVSEIILPDDSDMRIQAQADRAVLQAFKEVHPEIEVVRFGGIQMADLSMDVGPLMAIAGGISPQVIYVNFRKSDSYIRQGFLQPLNDFIARLPRKELNEIVLPAVKPVVCRKDKKGVEQWWALPFDNLVVALYYRKDLFHEAGLDPDRPPRTWDELMSYARRITNPAKGVYGFGMEAGPTASWNFYTFLLSSGARAVDQDANGEWHAAYDSPEAAEAVLFYARLCQEPFQKGGRTIPAAAYRDNELGLLWDQGKIGMYESYLNSKLIAAVNPELVGIAPPCLGPSGKRGSEVNSRCLGLYAGIKDPAIREAAWTFIHFWASAEAQRIRTKTFVENGYGQYLNPADLRRFGYTEYLRRVPKGWEQVFNETLRAGVPEPYGKNCDLIYWYLTKPLDTALMEKLGARPHDEAKKRILEVLRANVAEANEKMMGEVPPTKMRIRRAVAMVTAAAIVLAFCFAFRYLMRVFAPEGYPSSWRFWKYRMAYLLMAPAVILMAVWQYIPTIRGAAMAFLDYRIMGGSHWIGLDNFANVIFDNVFWSTLSHSIYYAVLTLVLGFVSPIVLAILLHEVPRGKVFFRLVFYLPSVVSGLVVIFLWKSFYDATDAGLLNRLLSIMTFGMARPIGWISDPKWAMVCVVMPVVWAGMGPGCLIYLAALKTVPDDLYEAAEIDGANTWGKLWNVTLPTLRPLIIISFVGAFVAAFKSSDLILAMTGGGPAGSTMVLDLQIFYDAFAYLRFGTATAMAWLLGFLLIGFTVYQMKQLSSMQFKATGEKTWV